MIPAESRVLVGTTCAPYKADDPSELTKWLTHATDWTGAEFFAAIETDARGLDPMQPLCERLTQVQGSWIEFRYDCGEDTDPWNRLTRICVGRNFVAQEAVKRNATHALFLDSDLVPDALSIEKLLELDVPVAGGDVPSYCLSGPAAERYEFPVQEHWNTAGYLLVKIGVLNRVRWGWGDGLTDDPWFARAVEQAGFGKTFVRKDCIGVHVPLAPVTERGHDLAYRREP